MCVVSFAQQRSLSSCDSWNSLLIFSVHIGRSKGGDNYSNLSLHMGDRDGRFIVRRYQDDMLQIVQHFDNRMAEYRNDALPRACFKRWKKLLVLAVWKRSLWHCFAVALMYAKDLEEPWGYHVLKNYIYPDLKKIIFSCMLRNYGVRYLVKACDIGVICMTDTSPLSESSVHSESSAEVSAPLVLAPQATNDDAENVDSDHTFTSYTRADTEYSLD